LRLRPEELMVDDVERENLLQTIQTLAFLHAGKASKLERREAHRQTDRQRNK
jgi:hypothetical protein